MLNFQDMIAKLSQYWADQGCLVHQGYDLEVGAGTFNPATFLRCLGPEPYKAVYVEPSRRPKDGRYGENPNRVQFYHQMQVILKPSPSDMQTLYLKSLEAIGLNLKEHDIRFVHDDWENPTIGAWGLGWEVWADGMEITQITYFQAVGGMSVSPISGEITYGLERLAMYIQGVNSIFDLSWNEGITYGDVFKRSEWEWSHYNFHEADAAMWLRHFEDFEKETLRLIKRGFPIPAYDFVMKASHAFNILDARGVISVTERTGYITRIRNLASLLAHHYVKSREEQSFPLLKKPIQVPNLVAPAPSTKCAPEERQDFLLEMGSEELPATFVPIGMQNLETKIREILNEYGLLFENVHVFGTPRRLSILITALVGGIQSKKTEKKGPSLASAFDESGMPTKAGGGFFRSLNMDEPPTLERIHKKAVKGIEVRKINDVPYLFATIEVPEVSTRKLLAESLPKLILSIDFPKKMRWGAYDIEYARPLKWIVALYGEEIIPFSLANILSGRESQGHSQLAPRMVSIPHPSQYRDLLRKNWVIADVAERKELILDQLKNIEEQVKGKAAAKERVLNQTLHLVEWPFLTAASFDERFLKAPKEVLISEMVEHQKYFPLIHANDTLFPIFVIVCNNTPSDLIREGNQKALSPRLADGMFLYEEDLKKPLESFNEKLKVMTFQKDLGSMWAKVERLSSYVSILYRHLPINVLKKVERAALLCKADLASELVGEFPELQGYVGKLYALAHKEDKEVAEAIEEHWMPKGEKAPLPKSEAGILLSLADKIDNFLTCFSLDLKPTSSSDPYALRRQALGTIRTLIEGRYFLSLRKVMRDCFDAFLQNKEMAHKLREEIRAKKESILQEIESFFINRIRTIFGEFGFEKDEIESILSQGLDSVYELYRKLFALKEFRKMHPDLFSGTLEIHTRVKKILFSQNPNLIPQWMARRKDPKDAATLRFPKVNPKLFRDESEKNLYQKLEFVEKAFKFEIAAPDAKDRNYERAFELLSELRDLLSDLFDKVKIVDDNPEIRTNRLALLQEVWDLCEELIDFSKIQEHALT